MSRRLAAARALIALVVLALAACGDDDDEGVAPEANDTPASLVEGVEAEISAIDNTFRPDEVEIEAGTEVVWTNDGRNDHNVVPVEEDDDWGVEVEEFAPDGVYRHRFTEPGTYDYYCSLHGTTTAGMVGKIIVTG